VQVIRASRNGSPSRIIEREGAGPACDSHQGRCDLSLVEAAGERALDERESDMKPRAFLGVGLLMTAFLAGLAAAERRDDEVMQLEKKAWDLWKQGDKRAFANLIADDFVAVDAHGIAGKAENVEDIDNLKKDSYDFSDFHVHAVSPDVVFLTYRVKLRATYKGDRIDGIYNVSSVWAKRKGRWLNVLYHETKTQ
jgi:ketosteroid isomerase-like protein